MRVTMQYRRDENGQWCASSDSIGWFGLCDTLEELRVRAAEGIRFAASSGETIEPPARSLFFIRMLPTPMVSADPEASEEFVLG